MYECCVSNHVQGWPKFAARQFALLPPSTDDAAVPGLAAVQYFDSESPAIALSDGSKVSVTVKTGYPFVRSLSRLPALCVYTVAAAPSASPVAIFGSLHFVSRLLNNQSAEQSDRL